MPRGFAAQPQPRAPTHLPRHRRLQVLLLLWFVVEDHDTLFVLSESVHFVGIGLLAYKLIRKRAAGGAPPPPPPAPCRCGLSLQTSMTLCHPAMKNVPPLLPLAGLSLRTQELTAAFLAVRLFCSVMMVCVCV